MRYFNEIPALPGTSEEKAWLKERVEVLSVKEKRILAASLMRYPARDCQEAINEILAIPDYELLSPAGCYEALGKLWADKIAGIPSAAQDEMDMWLMGQTYEDKHPGLFISQCYVEYPKGAAKPLYDGTNLDRLPDRGWSVRLRLSSPMKPDGVWLKLPDYSLLRDGMDDEVALALRELGVKDIRECELLDARCVLPEAGNLMEQYRDDLPALIRGGNDLGYALDERGQGMPDFDERLAEVLRHSRGHTLAEVISAVQKIQRGGMAPDLEDTLGSTAGAKEMGGMTML